jgi:hypothetical protein
VVSTSGMAKLAEEHDELIIGTERGLIDRLHQLYPHKTIVPLSRAAICGNMKVNTLAKLAWSSTTSSTRSAAGGRAGRAETALRRMLELSGGWRPPTRRRSGSRTTASTAAAAAAPERLPLRLSGAAGPGFPAGLPRRRGAPSLAP